MKVIRNGVFETNSSSTHSISLRSGDYIPSKLYVDEKGVCTIYTGDFGWGIENYYDAATKASYALTWAQNAGEYYLEMLKTVLQSELGDTVVIEFDGLDDGYIDHQSSDVCEDAFFSAETLHRFIFDESSVLHIDNDNH